MNKIFKVIWSKSRNCYVVASELAKGHTKASSTGDKTRRLALAAITALMLLPVGGFSYAADTATVNDTSGNPQTVYTKEGTDSLLEKGLNGIAELSTQVQSEFEVVSDAIEVQDGAIVKKNNTIGENVTNLDAALAKETAARLGADAAQDKVIKQVNDNLVASVNTINQNMATINQNVADGFTALSQADANEVATREAKDNELNERITNEANAIHETTNQLQNDLNTETTAREAADTALDTRITNVKEYLEKQASDNYVSKTDAAVQDGAVVKAANTIGENVTNLDAALAKETAARIGADAAQDKVIKQVNDNLVSSVDAINKNMAAGFNALSQADANELAGRVAADTKLAEAVNGGLSLSDNNVLQKNTTKVNSDGTVSTSKEAATTLVMNEGKENQITLSEKGVKVGTNSSVMDANGVYTGGDTYSEAKAALKSDGSIKGADGKFTVNSSNGTVNVNDQIELNGATGVVKSNGLNVGDGNMTVSNNGNIQTAGTLSVADGNFKVNGNGGVSAAGGKTTLASDGSIKAADGKFTVNSNGGVKAADGKITLSSDGSVKAADGKFTVNSNGGVKAADGKITLSSDGSVKAADGKFTVDTNGAVKAANGNTTIDSNGNLKTAGTLSAADGAFKVDSNGKITSTGLDAGNGTIQTTGTVQAGDVKTGTLETTGDATIGGDLTVNGKLNVDEIDMTKTGIVGDNNVTASTKVTAGEITSYKKATSTKDGSEKESAIDYDENGTSTWAKSTDADGNWNKSTLTVEGSDVTSKAVDSEKNSNQATQTSIQSQSTLTDANKNTNTATQSATESNSTLKDKDGKTSTFQQRVGEILNQINSSDTVFSKVDQKTDTITSEVTDGTNTTSSTQTTTDITNTASNGTITNEAQKLVNKASNTISNEAVNDITNTSTNGNISNTANNGTISNTAKNIENTASENITNTAKNGSITNDAKNIVNKASETLSNEAKNITNTTTDNMTNTIGKNLTTTVGGDMSTEVTGNQSNTVKGTLTETVTGKVTEDYKSDLETKVGGNETHYVAGNQTNTVSG
ncbi:MAG: ESPR-type extended signal peptide-containing protein, partial [Megasphaera sp.]|uniref:ESPR-type extended signal peptide-containing protein n=1 Tax=Megasphaera sp. TaxID=2023260 RepID=UPI003EFC4F2D